MIAARAILASLDEQDRAGMNLAALNEHIRGLVAGSEGDLAVCTAAFAAAQQWEAANGYSRAALHTSHQLALLANFAGDLTRLRRYYEETLRTLKRMRHREGAALCLRSVGELALTGGKSREAAQAWELSARLFEALALPEAEQARIWLRFAGPSVFE